MKRTLTSVLTLSTAFIAALAIAPPAWATLSPGWGKLSDGTAHLVVADNTGDGFSQWEKTSIFVSTKVQRQYEGTEWKNRTNVQKYLDMNGTALHLDVRYYGGFQTTNLSEGARDYGVTCQELSDRNLLTAYAADGVTVVGTATCVQIQEGSISNLGEANGPGGSFTDGTNAGSFYGIRFASWLTGTGNTAYQKYNISCHELGHIFGLPHHSNGTGPGCVGNYPDDNSEHFPDNNSYESSEMIATY